MKKIILIVVGVFYGLVLCLSVIWPIYVSCLNVEAYAILVTFMVVPTFHAAVHTQFRYAVMAHLLVITSLIFPSSVHDMREAKTIPYGHPVAFVTQDHTEWMAMADNLAFPFAEPMVSPTDYAWVDYVHTEINYPAMLASWLSAFLGLLTLRAIFTKLFCSASVKLATDNSFI